MLKNVNSLYVLENIYSHLKEEIKLNLIRYNKFLQGKLNINLYNYKIISKKYKKFESKIKEKENNADTDLLIHEGEFLKGKKNLKGKEYNDNGMLIYEGEYLNGKRWNGILKIYNNDIMFEIELIEGKINGKIKDFTFNNGNLFLEGNYFDINKWTG